MTAVRGDSPLERGTPADASPKDVFEVIRGRRSVRRFLPDAVDEDDLRRMLDAARWAPSGANAQPWHFVVVRDPATLSRMEAAIRRGAERLEESAGDGSPELAHVAVRFRIVSLFFSAAPVTLGVTVTAGPHGVALLNRLIANGMDPLTAYRKMGSIEIQSVAAAIQNLLLAAYALGYGGCWMNVPFVAKDDLESILRIEPGRDLIALVPVGRPAPGEPPGTPSRKAIEDIVTFL